MNEVTVYWLFVMSNLLFFIATIPLIVKIIKNRDILKDYSPTGSVITFTAVLLTVIAFMFMGNYASVLLSSTTLILWLSASVYSIKFTMGHTEKAERHIKDNVYMDRGTNNATKGSRYVSKRAKEARMSLVWGTNHHARPLRFGDREQQRWTSL